MTEDEQEYLIAISLAPGRLERFIWALKELPYLTDDPWEKHLEYAMQSRVDLIIGEAQKYREWQGFPTIPQLREIRKSLDELRESALSEDFLDDPECLVKTILDITQRYNALFKRLRENTHD